MGKKQPSPGKRAGSKNLPPWEAKKQEEKDFGTSSSGGKRARKPREYKDNRNERTSRPNKEGTDFRGRPTSRGFRGDDEQGGQRRPSPRFGDREERSSRPRRDDRDFKGRPSDRKFDTPRPPRRDDDRGGDRRPSPRFGDREERSNKPRRDDREFKGRPSDRKFDTPRPPRRDDDRGGDRRPSPRFGDREERRPRREEGDFKGRSSERKFDSARPRRDDDRGGYKGRPSDRSFGAPKGRRDDDRDSRGGEKRTFYNDRDKRTNYRDDEPRERRQRFDDFQGFSGPRVKKVEQMPLNKYLAHSGVCARREAADLIKEGKVMVNGKVVDTPGYKVQPDDTVTMSGKKLTRQKDFVYVLLNKPKDFLTTTDDPQGRKTVMDLVKGVPNDRLYPVGRLDRNTTGLLLLTNDGDLAQKLSHPKYNVKKIYQVSLDKDLTPEDFTNIMEGFELEDGAVKVDAMSYLESKKEVGIEIHSGRNRIVRRIFENFGYKVEKLDRVMYAGLTKKNINRGKWRMLSEREVVLLKHFKS